MTRIRYVGGERQAEVLVHTKGQGWRVYQWNAGNGFVVDVDDEELVMEFLEEPDQFARADAPFIDP
jgi:hypothetical protein